MKVYILFFTLILGVLNAIISQSYSDEIFNNYFSRSDSGWIASDGTISLMLPDGRTLWMFGDSHVDQIVDEENKIPCLFNTRNSLMIQDTLNNFTTVYDKTGTNIYTRQFVKETLESNKTYWPAAGFTEGNTAYLFWSSFEVDTQSSFGIKFSGMVIVEIALPEITIKKITPLSNPEIEFGMSVVKNETDGYYYIYGKHKDWIIFKPLVARCPIENIYSQWEYYTGNDSWTEDADEAIFIAPEVTSEYTVFFLKDHYYMFYQKNGFMQCGSGRQMYIYESEKPEGPFQNPILVYTIEDQFEEIYPVTYNGQAHPQFTKGDEILISYNLNKICPSPCLMNPFSSRFDADMYRPRFARVPLSMFVIPSETEEIADINIRLYPNPTTDILNVEFNEQMPTDVKIEVIGSNGLKIKEFQSTDTIRLDGLQNGIYFVRIKTELSFSTYKIIKF